MAQRPQSPTALPPHRLTDLIKQRRVVVCVGSGGVGKTTISAALALLGALSGRRTLVLTIDPAKRLADALGLPSIGHEIRRIPGERIRQVAELLGREVPARCSLDAMMLDQKRAFDEVVKRYAKDEEVKKRIMDNRIYQQVSGALAGSHEYAAMSKLYDIVMDDAYELIVMDTPPTENALDFLDAPSRIRQAVDSPALEWFIRPYMTSGTFSLKLVTMGGSIVLSRLARFVGSAFLAQMAQFFVEFSQVLAGFRERSVQVFDLMRRDDVAFMVICSPEPLSLDEALYFHGRLIEAGMPVGGFVLNRIHERGPEAPGRQALLDILGAHPALAGFDSDDLVQVAADLDRTYREQQILAAVDAKAVARLKLAADKGRAISCAVPLFEQDIYGAEGLALVSRHLMA